MINVFLVKGKVERCFYRKFCFAIVPLMHSTCKRLSLYPYSSSSISLHSHLHVLLNICIQMQPDAIICVLLFSVYKLNQGKCRGWLLGLFLSQNLSRVSPIQSGDEPWQRNKSGLLSFPRTQVANSFQGLRTIYFINHKLDLETLIIMPLM